MSQYKVIVACYGDAEFYVSGKSEKEVIEEMNMKFPDIFSIEGWKYNLEIDGIDAEEIE